MKTISHSSNHHECGESFQSSSPSFILTQLFALVLFLWGTALSAQDLIHFTNGQPPVRAQVQLIAIDLLKAKVIIDTPQGTASAERSFSMNDVAFIDFAVPQDISTWLAKPEAANIPKLIVAWNEHRPMATRAKHFATRIGLTLAELSLRDASKSAQSRALDIYTYLEKSAWDEADRRRAKEGRLRTWMAMGRLDEAEKEATSLAESSEDATLLIEARFIVAQAAEHRLSAFLKAHPRWEEDDEARPERDRLYHQAVDLYLWPALFHGTAEEASARGLLHAARLQKDGGEIEAAEKCAADVLALYPNSASAKAAQDFLTKLKPALKEEAP